MLTLYRPSASTNYHNTTFTCTTAQQPNDFHSALAILVGSLRLIKRRKAATSDNPPLSQHKAHPPHLLVEQIIMISAHTHEIAIIETLNLLTPHLLQLPRELRDMIYANLRVTFSNPVHIRRGTAPSIWSAHPEHKKLIRHLTVEVLEDRVSHNDLLTMERNHAVSRPELRKEWAELLELTRLKHLTINMQKYPSTNFSWAVFSPYFIQLRNNLPKTTHHVQHLFRPLP
ncbi:hypothetical protein EJ02DRAFT_421682 [Clathrospora elynae]|uniref:Uncharacterized protein n=1 Tax=Clathrospora elynae TaxID=706981 RepID=A0A6A5SR62_9PLEO|nr:hypothetical protein EJ02DRAFT_421682 [Clathrospora elynae]